MGQLMMDLFLNHLPTQSLLHTPILNPLLTSNTLLVPLQLAVPLQHMLFDLTSAFDLDDNNNAMVIGTNVIMNRQMEIVGFPGNKVINEKDAMDDL